MCMCNLLLDNVDFFLLARSGQPKTLSLFQRKELMSIFLNNSKLTEDMKMSLSHRLGVTQNQIEHFFQTQSKKPRNVSMEAYSKLLQGMGLNDITKSVHAHIYFVHQLYIGSMCSKYRGRKQHLKGKLTSPNKALFLDSEHCMGCNSNILYFLGISFCC